VLRLQSAASQSQHVVNILTSGDPVNAGDVDKVEADERNNNSTGLLAKGGPTAKIEVSVTLVVASPAAVLVQMSVSSTIGVACCHWSSRYLSMYLQERQFPDGSGLLCRVQNPSCHRWLTESWQTRM